MTESNINIKVQLDTEKVPQQISWSATGSSAEDPQTAKAMLLALWDGVEKTALKIDLWTKDMMTDEMADFYYQVLMTMGDTFQRATRDEELGGEIKQFAEKFHQKFSKKEEASRKS